MVLLAHASFYPSRILFPTCTFVSVMSTVVLKYISLFLPSVAVPLIHMEFFFFFGLEVMAVSSLCVGKKPQKLTLKKVLSFHCNTAFSLVPVIRSLSTFCGGKWVP